MQNPFLKQMSVQNRYAYIRYVYTILEGKIGLCQKVLKVSKNTIYNSLSISSPQQNTCDRKIKEIHSVYIHTRTIQNPHISGENLSKELYEFFGLVVSGRTVNRYRNEMKLTFRPPIRTVYISPDSAKKRYEFTKYHLENNTDFSKTVFTDESWFVIGRNKRWVWVDKTQITKDVISSEVSHPKKVMVWGGIGFNFKTDLIIVNGTLNSENYIDQIIFGSNLIEAADKQYGIGQWVLMQDNAPPHVSRETLAVLSELEISLLKDWPPHSPDLNIIEVVWAIMKHRVEALQLKTKDELIKIICDFWEAIQWQTVNKLVQSIPTRLAAVNANPHHTIMSVGTMTNC